MALKSILLKNNQWNFESFKLLKHSGTNDDSKYFEYNEETSLLVLKKNLDRETANRHKIKIQACDNGIPSLLV